MVQKGTVNPLYHSAGDALNAASWTTLGNVRRWSRLGHHRGCRTELHLARQSKSLTESVEKLSERVHCAGVDLAGKDFDVRGCVTPPTSWKRRKLESSQRGHTFETVPVVQIC